MSAVVIAGITAIAAIVGAFINGAFQRRKLGADATKIITEAATGVVERIERENDRLTEEMRQLRMEVAHEREDREREREEWRGVLAEHTRVLQEHVTWDMKAIQALQSVEIYLEPPPALYAETAKPSKLRGMLEG